MSFRTSYRCFKRSENLTADAGKDVVLGDNRCRWNTEILKQLTGIQDADIIYASFLSEVSFRQLLMHTILNLLKVFCPAFYVAYDHHERSVVVVIRGYLSLYVSLCILFQNGIFKSYSLQDILANLSAHPSLLITAGSLDIYAHKVCMISPFCIYRHDVQHIYIFWCLHLFQYPF